MLIIKDELGPMLSLDHGFMKGSTGGGGGESTSKKFKKDNKVKKLGVPYDFLYLNL